MYPRAEAPAIRGLSFRVSEGEIFGFLGPSGSGKTTTQKVLMGLLRGYSGSVTVMGRDLKTWDNRYYERIGVSFETPNHYAKLTARENLQFFGSLYQAHLPPIDELLERVGLAAEADQRVGEFSKGMRSRLTVARAILHQPDLLFLDEPTAGLDPGNARRIQRVIAAERERGATIFLTTHDMTVADHLCARVAFLVDGEIRALDAPRDLKLAAGRRSVRVEFVGENGELTAADFPLDGLGVNPTFLRLLQERDVQTIHSQEPTLAEVFMTLTGEQLQ